jgi:uncharacterized protein
MDMKGEYIVAAPREKVWAALNDVETLKAAIPGCQSIARLSETEIEATVTAKVGPVKATFKGLVTLSDLDPPNGYTIRGEGKGGAAGFAKGGAKVNLADDPGGTRLSYEVDAAVGGKLAQIGSRLIVSTAKKLADEFFSKFSNFVADAEADVAVMTSPSDSATVSGQTEASVTLPQTPKAMPLTQKAVLKWVLIVGGLIVVILAAMYGLSQG